MQKLLSASVILSLLTLSLGCHHTTKKYYEEDRHGDYHRESHQDYERHDRNDDHHHDHH